MSGFMRILSSTLDLFAVNTGDFCLSGDLAEELQDLGAESIVGSLEFG